MFKDWPVIKKLIWLKAAVLSGASAVLKTVTGNPVHILDALVKPAEALSVAFAPVQDLHGYDSPWPAGDGKNLWSPKLYDGTYNPSIGATLAHHDVSEQLTPDSTNSVYTITYTSSWKTRMMLVPVSDGNVYPYKYKISSTGNLGVSTGYLDADYKVLTVSNDTSTSQNKSGKLEPGVYTQNCAYWYFVFTNRSSSNVTITITEPQLELGSSATAYAPYSNECPISGWTGLTVYHSGEDTSNPTTYPITWQTEAGTVYGGTLDVKAGVLTVEWEKIKAKDRIWEDILNAGAHYFMCSNSYIRTDGFRDILCSHFKPVVSQYLNPSPDVTITNAWGRGSNINVRYDAIATLADWNTFITNNDVEIVWHISPQTYQLTPTEVQLLLGENNLWSDANGDLTLTYYADGRADDVEALNLLLGNRYVNNHEPDEPTDKEALDIILGRGER